MADDLFVAGLRFQTEGQEKAEKALRDNEAATKKYEKATQQLNSRMKVSVDKANKKAKTLGQLDSATKRAENEIKRLATSVEQGSITNSQYQGRLNQISAELRKLGLDKAQSKVMSYGRATREATTVVRQHEAAQKAARAATDNTTRGKQILTNATRQSTSAQQAARQQFLATANSIAVLDGPLGGIASRFSAFGVLIGRIGIPLAALSVGMTALGVVTSRTTRSFAEWEVQTAKIEAVMRATSNTFGVAVSDIEVFSSRLAVATLESETAVRSAAQQLLTFRNISGAVFEDVLRSAADLAAAGFGNMESATVQLAKALEDPRQGLTSLSRAGVTFTRQQRQLIMSLIETGDRARAMELILQNVNRQVGGVAESAARDTLAGDFDTIGQATARAARGIGAFLAAGVRLVSSPLASALEAYASGPATLAEELESVNELLRLYDDNLGQISVALERVARAQEAVEQSNPRRNAREREELELARQAYQTLLSQIGLEDDYQTLLEDRRRITDQIVQAEIDAQNAQAGRSRQNIDGLIEELQMRERLIGMSEQEARNVRTLVESELLHADINRLMRERVELLVSEGVDRGLAVAAAQELRSEMEKISLEALNALSIREETTRQAMRIADAVQQENELLDTQLRLMEDGYTATVARRLAQVEVERAVIETAIVMNKEAIAQAEINKQLEEAARLRNLNLNLANALAELDGREIKIARVDELSRGGRGGGGSGQDPDADYKRELDALTQYLQRRREEMMIARGLELDLVMEQYEERYQTLRNALDRGLITAQQAADKEVEIARSKADRIAEIERNLNAQRLGDMASFYGALAGIAQAGGDRMVKAVAAFRGAEAIINAWSAYNQVLADPSFMGRPWARMAAAANVLGAGLNAARNIATAGGGGGGAASRTPNAPREAREVAPQRVLIQGLDPNALYSGEQLEHLFEALLNENDNRGKVFVVSR